MFIVGFVHDSTTETRQRDKVFVKIYFCNHLYIKINKLYSYQAIINKLTFELNVLTIYNKCPVSRRN